MYEQVEIFITQLYETCSYYKEDDEKYFIFIDKHGCECFLGQVQIAVMWLQKC
jgi:hypothetical protein